MIDNFDAANIGRTAESVLCDWLESQLQVMGPITDPSDPQLGVDGRLWDVLSTGDEGDFIPYRTEDDLARCRRIGEWLYWACPWARAAQENRVSYVVGFGHTYSVNARKDREPTGEQKRRVYEWLKEWQKLNRWSQRQRDNQLQGDMLGDVFLRKFDLGNGFLVVRPIHPSAVKRPDDKIDDRFLFGIETDPNDVETVLNYWVNGEPIEASLIQHRKYCPPPFGKRGTPLLWAWRFHFQRALNMLRNGSKVVELQATYAVIKKVAKQMAANMSAWAAGNSNARATVSQPGMGTGSSNATNYQNEQNGKIVTIPDDQQIELPGIGIDPSRYDASVGTEMRSVAAAIVMPEFMMCSDARNANRASSIVAGDPAEQNFLRLQQQAIDWDLEIINEAAQLAVAFGVLQEADLEDLEIVATAPELSQKDKLKDAQSRKIDIESGILSVKTATVESGRDPEVEQRNKQEEREENNEMRIAPQERVDNMPEPIDGEPDEGDEDDEPTDSEPKTSN